MQNLLINCRRKFCRTQLRGSSLWITLPTSGALPGSSSSGPKRTTSPRPRSYRIIAGIHLSPTWSGSSQMRKTARSNSITHRTTDVLPTVNVRFPISNRWSSTRLWWFSGASPAKVIPCHPSSLSKASDSTLMHIWNCWLLWWSPDFRQWPEEDHTCSSKILFYATQQGQAKSNVGECMQLHQLQHLASIFPSLQSN